MVFFIDSSDIFVDLTNNISIENIQNIENIPKATMILNNDNNYESIIYIPNDNIDTNITQSETNNSIINVYPTLDNNSINENLINNNDITHTINAIKIIILYIVTLLYLPFIICDFYYSITDKSCLNDDNNYLSLKNILFINACYSLLVYFIILVVLFYSNKNYRIEQYIILNILIKLFNIFNLIVIIILTFTEIYTFSLISKYCNNSLYSYMFVNIILNIIGLLSSFLSVNHIINYNINNT
jgi:hypothetical protein